MTTPPTDRPLTPGEALAKLFMDNTDRGANAANDYLVEELQKRIRALRNTTVSRSIATNKTPVRPLVEQLPPSTQLPAAGPVPPS